MYQPAYGEHNFRLYTFGSKKFRSYRIVYLEKSQYSPDIEECLRHHRLSSLKTLKQFDPQEKKDERDYLQESLNRSILSIKKNIRHSVCHDTKFLTLTYAKGNHGKQKLYWDIQNMAKRYTHYVGKRLEYICVPEWHKTDHGLHAHLCINSPYIDNALWAKKLWRQGFIKVNASYSPGHYDNPIKIANYMTKYLRKEFLCDPKWKKRYTSSRNWKKAPNYKISYIEDHDDPENELIQSMQKKITCSNDWEYVDFSGKTFHYHDIVFEERHNPILESLFKENSVVDAE